MSLLREAFNNAVEDQGNRLPDDTMNWSAVAVDCIIAVGEMFDSSEFDRLVAETEANSNTV
jgi:hypothetical protein